MQAAENGGADLSLKGGPGAPGTFVLPGFVESLSAIFDGQYDIVSWDPRGSASYYTLYGFLSNPACIAFTLPIALEL